jgi:hypothetical protein
MGNFFVQDRAGDRPGSGNYYPATFLTYADGTPVVDEVLARGISPYTERQLTLTDEYGNSFQNVINDLVVPSADFMNNMYARGQTSWEYASIVRTGLL